MLAAFSIGEVETSLLLLAVGGVFGLDGGSFSGGMGTLMIDPAGGELVRPGFSD